MKPCDLLYLSNLLSNRFKTAFSYTTGKTAKSEIPANRLANDLACQKVIRVVRCRRQVDVEIVFVNLPNEITPSVIRIGPPSRIRRQLTIELSRQTPDMFPPE